MRDPVRTNRIVLLHQIPVQSHIEHILFQKPHIEDGLRISAESVNHLIVNELLAFLGLHQHDGREPENQCRQFLHKPYFQRSLRSGNSPMP